MFTKYLTEIRKLQYIAKKNRKEEKFSFKEALEVMWEIPFIHYTHKGEDIIKDQELLSHGELEDRHSGEDFEHNTEEVDRIFGLNEKVFFSYGVAAGSYVKTSDFAFILMPETAKKVKGAYVQKSDIFNIEDKGENNDRRTLVDQLNYRYDRRLVEKVEVILDKNRLSIDDFIYYQAFILHWKHHKRPLMDAIGIFFDYKSMQHEYNNELHIPNGIHTHECDAVLAKMGQKDFIKELDLKLFIDYVSDNDLENILDYYL